MRRVITILLMPNSLFPILLLALLTTLVSTARAVAQGDDAAKPNAVIVVGTHHYSPQRSMPKFAAELERLGFETTVVNPDWDPEKDKRGLPGLETLAEADVAIFFIRFLKLDDEQLGHVTRYVEAGKPVVCFRTSTHGFNYPNGHPHREWNDGFGRDAFGTPYQIHLQGATEVTPAIGARAHPIMTGVEGKKWKSPGTLYLTKLEPGITPLLLGTGKSKPGTRTNQFGTYELKSEMTDTIAWTWENRWGGRAFSTSLGHLGDFAVPQSMRVMVNGVFWAAGVPVPKAEVHVNTIPPADSGKPKTTPQPPAKVKKAAAPATPKGLADTQIEADAGIVFYGNSFIERLQEEGTLEAILQLASPGRKQQFRSLAFTGDEVGFRIRPEKFGDHLAYLTRQFRDDQVVMCFGMNEAFGGEAGLPAFEKDLQIYLELITTRHPDSDFFLVSPTAVEPSASPDLPNAETRNQDVALYSAAINKAAEAHGIAFIDLFGASQELYAASNAPLTSNGLHLNGEGNRQIAAVLARSLGDGSSVNAVDLSSPAFGNLRQLISRKTYEIAMAYRPSNGIHYYGTRGRDYEYNAEIPHHLRLANLLDEAIWKQAAAPASVVAFPELPTARAQPPARAPRRGLGVIKTSEEDLADFTVADGFSVNLFASSEDHPELVNPLQIRFDGRGRLWVTCVPSYPVPVPGTLSNDSILIFEDIDGDGRADKKTVFADGLKIPDGFVFYKDGIIISEVRRLVWLRDPDGDGIADFTEELLRGADDTDTHHGGYLSRTPQGQVIYCEGLFHRGQFETPWGLQRTKDASALHLDPGTGRLSLERQTSHPNPWKISYDRWGQAMQMFGGGQIIDVEFYNVATPLGTSSGDLGMPFRDDKGCTLEFVSSPNFPDDWQGGLITGHLLGKNSVFYTPLKIEQGTFVNAAKPANLVTSSNKTFRPVDLCFGTDGALYISDFYYPIIGHAQHSIRDLNRDYDNGRIWRVTYDGKPLAEVPVIHGADVPALIDLLAHPQVRVRELARWELERHPDAEVLAAAAKQLPRAREEHEFGLEILWLLERCKSFDDPSLLRDLLASDQAEVRRSAVRSIRFWAPTLEEDARSLLTGFLTDEDARTRMAALSVISYLQASEGGWEYVIDELDSSGDTPFAKMAALAALYDTPELSPQFPLLQIDPAATLQGWSVDADGASGSLWVQSETPQDLILGFRNNAYMNLDVNTLPVLRSTGSLHTKSGQLNVSLKEGLNEIHFFSQSGGKPKKGPVDLYLTTLIGGLPEAVEFAPDPETHLIWGKTYSEANDVVTADRILIRAVPSQLAFNVRRFEVKAGQEYQFVFENPDHMLHNLVVTKPDSAEQVGDLADAMAIQPDAMEKHFVPESELVLFATEQIPHGGRIEKAFTAPAEPGLYPVICTFPGHWRVMKAVMEVVEER